ncbi:SWIM zinc finger family protein [Haladaptatus halobius]|uniref:SWIM zinc finger family protein n=1 Tax=Haladaptatus halobius TaxID=2884875 RepID=UPI001D09F8FE|nr:SWIM zinc finger family protein [Haladaptatus halobius]
MTQGSIVSTFGFKTVVRLGHRFESLTTALSRTLIGHYHGEWYRAFIQVIICLHSETIYKPEQCLEALGMVDVTNESHDNPAEHHYVVTLDDVTGELMTCTCPHHLHRNAYCKHMAAVDNATDDGTLEAFPSEDSEDDAEPEDCDCDGLGGFPCWSYVRTGRKELPH